MLLTEDIILDSGVPATSWIYQQSIQDSYEIGKTIATGAAADVPTLVCRDPAYVRGFWLYLWSRILAPNYGRQSSITYINRIDVDTPIVLQWAGTRQQQRVYRVVSLSKHASLVNYLGGDEIVSMIKGFTPFPYGVTDKRGSGLSAPPTRTEAVPTAIDGTNNTAPSSLRPWMLIALVVTINLLVMVASLIMARRNDTVVNLLTRAV